MPTSESQIVVEAKWILATDRPTKHEARFKLIFPLNEVSKGLYVTMQYNGWTRTAFPGVYEEKSSVFDCLENALVERFEKTNRSAGEEGSFLTKESVKTVLNVAPQAFSEIMFDGDDAYECVARSYINSPEDFDSITKHLYESVDCIRVVR